MLLAQPDMLLSLMGLGAAAAGRVTATNALHMASTVIEGILETRLAYGSYTDIFSVDKYTPYSFRLTHGFLREDTVEVRYRTGPSRDAFDGIPEYVSVQSEPGLVVLTDPLAVGVDRVSITYDYGFLTDSTDDVPEGIPDWLRDAALIAATHLLNVVPSTQANRKVGMVTHVSQELRRVLFRLMAEHLRPRMLVSYPSRSQRNG